MTKLTVLERDVWFSIARAISATGISPSYRDIGDDIDRDHTRISQVVSRLINLGLIEKTGNRYTLTLHVLVWPDNIQPRKTIGRKDGTEIVCKPVSREPQAEGKMPNFKRSETTCVTPGCRLTRQPGRRHCAACLNQTMPENTRARNVFEGSVFT